MGRGKGEGTHDNVDVELLRLRKSLVRDADRSVHRSVRVEADGEVALRN
jgi:hypothetical protein